MKKSLSIICVIILLFCIAFSLPLSAAALPKATTNVNLVNNCYQALADGWGYVYGASGETCSIPMLAKLSLSYPDKFIDEYLTQCHKWLGKPVADCSGLICTVTTGGRTGATQLYDECSMTGSISTLPEVPGVLLFVGSPDKMTHCGVYVGGGYVIHSANVKSGVVKTKIDSSWNYWGYTQRVTYIDDTSGIITQNAGANTQNNGLAALFGSDIFSTTSETDNRPSISDWILNTNGDTPDGKMVDLGWEGISGLENQFRQTTEKVIFPILLVVLIVFFIKDAVFTYKHYEKTQQIPWKSFAVYVTGMIVLMTANAYIWDLI